MNQKPSGNRQPAPDLRTPEDKALWQEIREGLAEKRKKAKLPPSEPLPDIWLYDSEHLLRELTGIREMILLIPDTLEKHSARQSAIDRIWRVEQDLRFLLSTHRDQQHAFGQKAAVQEIKVTTKEDKSKVVRIRA